MTIKRGVSLLIEGKRETKGRHAMCFFIILDGYEEKTKA